MASRNRDQKEPHTDDAPTRNGSGTDHSGLAICDKDYPKHVFFIIGNEFCERFCFYGMKAVLLTYLLRLNQTNESAATIYHAFTMVAYFTPLLGAILADNYIGRYWTIVSLSIVYVIGNIVMATTALNGGYLLGAIIGMVTIAIGTGGIKPCVSAFGADQFPSSMSKAQESFFSMFYVAINAGALMSQIITPILKEQKCFGEECWSGTFGLPAILMILALVLFLIGSPFYHRVPANGDSVLKIFRVIFRSIIAVVKPNRAPVNHWLDRAVGDDITMSFIDDCKAVFKILALFLPLPFFWALFDQQGSLWIIQAMKMDSYIAFANYQMPVELIQVFNGLLIVVCVPLFELVIYPVFERCCNVLVKPLQKMVAGCVLCAMSFVIIAFIQIAVNQNDVLSKGDVSTYRIRVFNFDSACSYRINTQNGKNLLNLLANGSDMLYARDFVGQSLVILPESGCPCTENFTVMASLNSPISSLEILKHCQPPIFSDSQHSHPSDEFLDEILVTLLTNNPNVLSMKLSAKDGLEEIFVRNHSETAFELDYFKLNSAGRYKVQYVFLNGSSSFSQDFVLRQGGAYTIFYGEEGNIELLIDKLSNGVSVFWQFFPYLVITWGEIMFSITGLSFAFSQAPASMKSTLQAAWLLAVSLGNIIDLIIINIKISDKAVEFFVFAAIMTFVTTVFGVMAYRYEYVDSVYGHKKSKQSDAEKLEVEDDGKLNCAASLDTQNSPTLAC